MLLLYLLLALLLHIFFVWADAYIYRPITMQMNFPLSYPMTACSFLGKHGFLNKSEIRKNPNEQGRLDALKVNYPKQKLTFPMSCQRRILSLSPLVDYVMMQFDRI